MENNNKIEVYLNKLEHLSDFIQCENSDSEIDEIIERLKESLVDIALIRHRCDFTDITDLAQNVSDNLALILNVMLELQEEYLEDYKRYADVFTDIE